MCWRLCLPRRNCAARNPVIVRQNAVRAHIGWIAWSIESSAIWGALRTFVASWGGYLRQLLRVGLFGPDPVLSIHVWRPFMHKTGSHLVWFCASAMRCSPTPNAR